MSLILATGSNQGNRLEYLSQAKSLLEDDFQLIAESRVYESPAVDYLDQPDFLNQVLEFKTPNLTPATVLAHIQKIEKSLGRQRVIDKGPRTIDIDILFYDLQQIESQSLTVPHPSWSERSFVVKPLLELPFAKIIRSKFTIPDTFDNVATPYEG